MTYILIGITGFIVFHLLDITAIKRIPLLKPATWVPGSFLVIYAIIMTAITGEKIFWPTWLSFAAWIILLLASFQVIYSLFINLPFGKTYIKKGVGDELITTGLYGIVRHPGVWGLGLVMLSAAVVSGSRLLLTATPIWMTVDIAVVFLQDRFFFEHMYPSYSAYRQRTPFLIPNLNSLTWLALSDDFTLSNLTSRRPIVSNLSDLFAQKKYDEVWQRCCSFIDLSLEDFMRIQKRLLMEQLQLFSRCALGKHLMGDLCPESIEEFRDVIPLTTYDDYAPYLLKRRMDVLPKKPLLWQYTSGKTGEYAYRWVPATARLVDEIEPYIFALMLFANARSRGDFNLKQNDKVFYGMAPPPYATGSMARAFPHQLFRMLPKLEDAERMGFEDRVKAGFDMALKEGLDLTFAMSSMAVAIGNRFGQQGQIHTGLKGLLKKNPKAQIRLIKAMAKARLSNRGVLPKDLWRVKGLVTYGIDGEIFRDKIRDMWGCYPLDFHGCTEALIIAMQTWDHLGMTFVPNLQFFEFIPEDEAIRSRENPEYRPRTLLMDELKPGNYELVVTSFHGGPFLRYRLGQLVKILSMRNEKLNIDIPQMSFISRIDDQIDIAGFTRLGEKVIWQAIENTGVEYEDWVACKETSGRPILHLFVELKNGNRNIRPDALAAMIHQQLKRLDQPYDDLENLAGIHPLRITLLPEGAFNTYALRQLAAGAGIAHRRPIHINPPSETISFLVNTAAIVKARKGNSVEV